MRDRSTQLAAADCVVLGASFDTPAENKVFADAERFGFRLLADPDQQVGTTYEVLRAPSDPYGGLPMRIAYLIDPNGDIRKAYDVRDVASFADEVVSDLETLQAS